MSRTELDRIKGTRPRYEEDFLNDLGRYNVKYKHLDAKIKGKAQFKSPTVQPRIA